MSEISKKASDLANGFAFILGDESSRLPVLLMQIFCALILDIVGIGFILPFLTLISNPEIVDTYLGLHPILLPISALDYESLVWISGAAFLIMFIFKSGFSLWINANIGRFAYQQDTRARVRLLYAYLFCNYEFHLGTDRASVFNAMIQNVNKYSLALVAGLRCISEALVLLFMALIVLIASPASAFAVLGAFTPIAVLYILVVRKRSAAAGELAVVSNKDMYKHIQESIEGMKEIRVLGAEPTFLGRLHGAGLAAQQASTVLWVLSLLPRYFLEVTFVALTVLGLFYMTWIGQDVQSFVPQLGVMALIGLRLMPSVGTIMTSVTSVRASLPAVKELEIELRAVESFLQNPEKSPDKRSKNSLTAAPGEVGPRRSASAEEFLSIEVKGVYFAYDDARESIFSDLNLIFNKQVSTGIIGPSGSGKTTLMNLLLGFLKPQVGQVLLNGEEISDDLTKWYNMLAYIPQFTFLGNDTVRRNIALGLSDEEINDGKVREAIRLAQLDEFILNQKDGIDTLIGDAGLKLSGGQRQRLAIARALYFDRQVLVFDEATSALDQDTEERILRGIYSLKDTVTIIIVSHRPATLAFCDQIVKVSGGDVGLVSSESVGNI